MNFNIAITKFKQAACLGLVTLMACAGLMLGWGEVAMAQNGIDQVAGAGTTNQIQGRAQEDIGRVQRQVDNATSQVEGTAKQIKGRAQQDIGRTQQAAEEAADTVEDATEGFMDAAKDFFGQ